MYKMIVVHDLQKMGHRGRPGLQGTSDGMSLVSGRHTKDKFCLTEGFVTEVRRTGLSGHKDVRGLVCKITGQDTPATVEPGLC